MAGVLSYEGPVIQAYGLCTSGEPPASLDIRVHVRTTQGVTNKVPLRVSTERNAPKYRFSDGS